jgi:DNA-binding response OmpR family regulator
MLDLKMPRMSGFDVLKWLRKQGGVKRLRVVVFSSSAEPQDVNAAADLGANSYLVKPPAFQELTSTISGMLNYWLQFDQKPQCC